MTTATAEKTTQKKKEIVPPKDSSGESRKAFFMLGRMRKELDKLPLPWRKWVAESLVEGLPVPDEESLDQE